MYNDVSLFPTPIDEQDMDETFNNNRYEVYVNGDFIGIKSLLGHNETIDDLTDFLYEQGFKHFNGEPEGDQYNIETEKRSNDLKEALHVLLQSR